MDAHLELNALESRIASESIDGAGAHDLADRDRELVAAFMRGVHSTERLKFDHPGLGTLATRTGPALVRQNDLGTTDAHVVVIRVAGRMVTVTYTDVHLTRLLFVQALLSSWHLDWEDTRSRNDKAIEAASTTSPAADSRPAMRPSSSGSSSTWVRGWCSSSIGTERASVCGGWSAAEQRSSCYAGESLQDVLGARAAEQYLRAVLRICADGLLAGKAVSLVQDEVRAELTGYLRSARQEIHGLALQHAELSVEIAEAARDALEHMIAGADDRCCAAAARAGGRA